MGTYDAARAAAMSDPDDLPREGPAPGFSVYEYRHEGDGLYRLYRLAGPFARESEARDWREREGFIYILSDLAVMVDRGEVWR